MVAFENRYQGISSDLGFVDFRRLLNIFKPRRGRGSSLGFSGRKVLVLGDYQRGEVATLSLPSQ